jgi:hypothetical protein
MSRSIGKALPDDAFDRPFGALHVVYAKPHAVRISKIELRQIAVQVLLAAMLIDSLHATFEDRIIAFNGVGVNMAANVFLLAVIYAFMARKFGADFEILASFVSHQGGFAGHIGTHDWRNVGNGGAINMETAGTAAPLDQGENRILMAPNRRGASVVLAAVQ